MAKKKTTKKKKATSKRTNKKADRKMNAPKPDGYSFGRPTDYKPEYCQMLVKHMGEGLSFGSFASVVSVDKATIYVWRDTYQDFHDAKKDGDAASLYWWETIGRAGTGGQLSRTSKEVEHYDGEGRITRKETIKDRAQFSAAGWIFNMKNRHGWTDRREITGAGGGPITTRDVSDMTPEEIQKELDDMDEKGI